ncbi:hypothetical protein EGX28_10695, partial [Enterococcus avium]
KKTIHIYAKTYPQLLGKMWTNHFFHWKMHKTEKKKSLIEKEYRNLFTQFIHLVDKLSKR